MKGLERKYFLNNLGLLFSARGKVLNSFKKEIISNKKKSTREPATEPEVAKEPIKATQAKINAKYF